MTSWKAVSCAAAVAACLTLSLGGAKVDAAELGATDEPIKLALNEWTGQHITTRVAGEILQRVLPRFVGDVDLGQIPVDRILRLARGRKCHENRDGQSEGGTREAMTGRHDDLRGSVGRSLCLKTRGGRDPRDACRALV